MSRSATIRSEGVFVLFADCVPVKGARRSVLCDLQRGRLRFIPSVLYDILTLRARLPLEDIQAAYSPADRATIEQYLKVLVREEYGFWTDEPAHFTVLDQEWDVAARCTNAIIDVSSESSHDFASIFEQLDSLGCLNIQLRIHDEMAPETLLAIVRQAEGWRFRHLELIAKATAHTTAAFVHELCMAHHIVTRAILHGATEDSRSIIEMLGTEICTTVAALDLHACGQVDPRQFAVNIHHFTEARCSNSCLNRKMSVAANGDLMACPSMRTAYGNARTDRLADVLEQPGLRALWNVTKDQVAVCKDCEFRYVCTDCRAHTVDGGLYSKPSSCRYDPYTARWE